MTVLVTGSTDGHGRRVAVELAARGHTVLVHGRDRARAEAVLAELPGDGHAVVLADLASLAEARRLAGRALDRAGRVDVLVCNAGVWLRERRESADGIELTLAVNHLAHVALTEALAGAGAAPERIVNVASVGQRPFDWDDPLLERSFEGFRAYAQSKLAQVMWTFDLAERFGAGPPTADALHPATLMDTTMVRGAFGRARSTVDEGAAATVRLVGDRSGTGRYFDGMHEARAHPAAYDDGERARLRALTERLLRRA